MTSQRLATVPLTGDIAASLASWMEGRDLDKPASAWFGRGTPKASIAGGFVESLIASAEKALDEATPSPNAMAHWIAGTPAIKAIGLDRASLIWAYRGELRSVELPRAAANAAFAALSSPRLGIPGMPYADLEAELALPPPAMAELLSAGLVVA